MAARTPKPCVNQERVKIRALPPTAPKISVRLKERGAIDTGAEFAVLKSKAKTAEPLIPGPFVRPGRTRVCNRTFPQKMQRSPPPHTLKNQRTARREKRNQADDSPCRTKVKSKKPRGAHIRALWELRKQARSQQQYITHS